MGDVAGGEESLSRVKVPSEGELPPTLEGLVSTIGDYELAQGRPDKALVHYDRIYAAYSSRLPGYAARHLVRGLLHVGDLRRARAAVQFADEILTEADRVERANLEAARFMLESAIDGFDRTALVELLSTPSLMSDSVTRAEVVLHAAQACVNSSHFDTARGILHESGPVLQALGRSGWHLLAPPGADIDLLQQLSGMASEIVPRLDVFGRAQFERDGQRRRLSRRYAEIITVLAYSSNGLSGEALLLELYGDEGQMSSLKSTVSRARRYVKIDSTPYRLGERVRVDALELDHHLTTGDLQQALELYQGPLLPESEAPGIVRERERIDEALRQAVLLSGEPELTLRLARKFQDDLDLWERAKELTPQDDPAYPLIRARVRRIRGEWGL